MDLMNIETYEGLVADSEVVSEDHYGPKVLRLNDGSYVKIFRLKRPWSSGRWKPYALRFAQNVSRLVALGVPTVAVSRIAYCRPLKKHMVFYRPLQGQSLRELLGRADQDTVSDLLRRFGGFISDLHDSGIYFRSAHFGNIIVTEQDGSFGLIDVADMRFYKRALSNKQRVRNFRHMSRYSEDRAYLFHEFGDNFWQKYFDGTDFDQKQQEDFITQVKST